MWTMECDGTQNEAGFRDQDEGGGRVEMDSILKVFSIDFQEESGGHDKDQIHGS